MWCVSPSFPLRFIFANAYVMWNVDFQIKCYKHSRNEYIEKRWNHWYTHWTMCSTTWQRKCSHPFGSKYCHIFPSVLFNGHCVVAACIHTYIYINWIGHQMKCKQGKTMLQCEIHSGPGMWKRESSRDFTFGGDEHTNLHNRQIWCGDCRD